MSVLKRSFFIMRLLFDGIEGLTSLSDRYLRRIWANVGGYEIVTMNDAICQKRCLTSRLAKSDGYAFRNRRKSPSGGPSARVTTPVPLFGHNARTKKG
jgi:hypothetical protein